MKKLILIFAMTMMAGSVFGQWVWSTNYNVTKSDSLANTAYILIETADSTEALAVDSLIMYLNDLYEGQLSNEAGLYAALSDVTQFIEAGDDATLLDGTAYRIFYTDASGDVTELALGTNGQVLTSNGPSAAPTFETPTVVDSNFVSVTFTPTSSITPSEGEVYYDSDVDSLYVYDGSNYQALNASGSGGSMTYPGAGIPVSSGSAWGTSITNEAGLYTNLSDVSQFLEPADAATLLDGTANTILYIDASGNIQEASLGSNGTYLQSQGDGSAPIWSTPAGAGDVTKVGTPVDNQIGIWTGNGTIEGDVDLTFDGDDLTVDGIVTGTGFNIGAATIVEADLEKIDGISTTKTELGYLSGADADLGTFSIPASTTISSFAATLTDDLTAAAFLSTLGLTSTVAELNYTDNVTSNIQTQLNSKQSTLSNEAGLYAALSDVTQFYEAGDEGTIAAAIAEGELSDDIITEANLKAVNLPTDEYVLTYEATTGDFQWEADQTGGTPATADISDVNVTQTEFAELETIDTVTVSHQQWINLGNDEYFEKDSAITLVYRRGVNATASVTGDSTFVDLDSAENLTITGNWVNTANPWADNEVANDITASNYEPLLTNEAGLYSALSDVTDFVQPGDAITGLDGTADRILYTDGSGNVTELAFGTDGQVLTSTGSGTAPAFEDATGGSGGGLTQPTFSSAEIGTLTDSTIALIWSKNLYAGANAAPADFTVTEDGNAYGINSLSYSDDTILLVGDSAGAYGSTYLIDYDPGTNPVKDSVNLWALAFTDNAVTNNIDEPVTGLALTDSLVSYWAFEETSGDAIDSHGSYDLTNSAVTYDTTGLVDSSYYYGADASSRVSSFTGFNGSAELSFGGWIYQASGADYNRHFIGHYYPVTNTGIALIGLNTWIYNVNTTSGTGGDTIVETNPLNDNRQSWNHVMITYDGDSVKCYINAERVDAFAKTGETDEGSIQFNIGGYNGQTFRDATSRIDEVGVWRRALSPAEITTLYNSGSGITYTDF